LAGRGFHKGTSPTKTGMTWNDRDENNAVTSNELVAVPGKSAVASQNFGRTAFGADGRITFVTAPLGATTAYGEVIWAKNLGRGTRFVADPVAIGRDVSGVGYNLALVQDIYSHMQIGVRYDHYNPDRDHADLQGAQQVLADMGYQTVAVAVAARIPGARLVMEYDFNRNHKGRNSAGMPTNLADNAFLMRAEVLY
jgi:hypothetical protein